MSSHHHVFIFRFVSAVAATACAWMCWLKSLVGMVFVPSPLPVACPRRPRKTPVVSGLPEAAAQDPRCQWPARGGRARQ